LARSTGSWGIPFEQVADQVEAAVRLSAALRHRRTVGRLDPTSTALGRTDRWVTSIALALVAASVLALAALTAL
jgi:hypothetical protein